MQNDAAFIGGIDFANVQASGGSIDTNGLNVALTMPLSTGSPSGSIAKTGAGSLTFSTTPSTYTGVTRGNSGTLVLPSPNNLPRGNALTLGGRRLLSQDAGGGQRQSFGKLRLISATSSGIDLGAGLHQIDFSTLVTPSGAGLSVTGWQGSPNASGTAAQIRFNSIGDSATANSVYSQFLAVFAYPDLSITGAGLSTTLPTSSNWFRARRLRNRHC